MVSHPGRLIALLIFAALASPVSAASAAGWTAAESVATDGYGLVLGTADDGTALLAWTGTTGTIRTAIRPPGGPLTLTGDLPCPSGDTCSGPRIAVDARGDAVLVWQAYDGTNYRLESASRPAGGTWSDPAAVSADVDAIAQEPRVAILPSGKALAVWTHKSGDTVIIRAARKPMDGNWRRAETISSAPSDWPSIAVAAGGNATIAWVQNGAVEDATGVDDGKWTLDPSPPPSPPSVFKPEVAMGPDGQTLLAFADAFDEDSPVLASVRSPGGGWSVPANVGIESSYRDPFDVAFDSADAASVLFVEGPGGSSIAGPWAASGSSAFTLANSLELRGFSDTYSPHVSGGADGQTVAAWLSISVGTAPAHVQATVRSSDAAWDATQDLGPGGSPDDAVDGEGDAVVAWATSTGITLMAHDISPPDVSSLTVPRKTFTGQDTGFAIAALDRWSVTEPVRWDFGDGSTAAGASVTHAYAAPGTYTVRATVADVLDNATTVQQTIIVRTR